MKPRKRKNKTSIRRPPWKMSEVEYLKDNYVHYMTAGISEVLGRTLQSVYQKARQLGLYKTPNTRRLTGIVRERAKREARA